VCGSDVCGSGAYDSGVAVVKRFTDYRLGRLSVMTTNNNNSNEMNCEQSNSNGRRAIFFGLSEKAKSKCTQDAPHPYKL
jgi:hypothetical protein